jgi:hypothetical protein
MDFSQACDADGRREADRQPKGKILLSIDGPAGYLAGAETRIRCGVDYIAVYADEEPDPARRWSSSSLTRQLGVKTEAVALRDLKNTIRAVATVQANERLLHTVTSKFDGWIQRLYVNTTGQAVRKGEALMDVYSPDLITAQQEYLIARKGVQTLAGGSAEVQASMQRLEDSALQRLRNWDISETELRGLTQDGKTQYLTLRSPANGGAGTRRQGKRFMGGSVVPGRRPVTVWLLAEVFEQARAGAHRTVVNIGRCLSGEGVRRQGDFHLSHRHRREPHCQSADRTGQSAGTAQAVHVRAGGVHGCARQRASAKRARFGGTRYRYAATGAGAARRGEVRAAPG